MQKDALMLKVRQHLVEYPGDAADILSAVSAGLKEFERVQRNARSREGLAAMTMFVLSQPLSPTTEVYGVAYMAYQLYPSGVRGGVYAPVEYKWWGTFRGLCAKADQKDLDGYFAPEGLAERGMPGISKWWAEVVRPEIDQMTQEKS